MSTDGASVYVHDRAFDKEDRKNLFIYFMPVGAKFEPEQEIKYKQIDLPSAKLIAYALEKTKRNTANLAFEELDRNSALELLFSAYRNDNLKTKQLTLGNHVSVRENIDSGDAEVIYTDFLKIKVKSLSIIEAEQLIKIINSGKFSSIEIAIEEIHEGNTLTLLGVIGQNPYIEHIDIKIPLYNVNNMDALRAFLAKPLVTPHDDIASLTTFMQRVALDLSELRSVAQTTFESVRQTGGTFLNAYVVGPTLSFLAEEEENPAINTALAPADSNARQSPKRPH
ncbi:MAG: hypothetical protein HYX61_13595 [Gammaproteobacteria bacterium]|jgi:hypothetical protein|nr:hypothetical protein [Gammaproteobacteria bacterium]